MSLRNLISAAAVGACLIASAPAMAQTVGSTDSGNCYPFVCNDSGVDVGQAIDYYQIYSATAFSGITTFDTITFFSTLFPGAEILSGDYDISFGVTTDSVGAAYAPTLFDVSSFFVGALGGANLSISGNAFVYDPTDGNLVMHVIASNLPLVPNGSQANGAYMDADYTGITTSRAYNNGVELEASGTGALVTRFSNSGAIPEPATWALMLIGFGAAGGVLRSHRRRELVA